MDLRKTIPQLKLAGVHMSIVFVPTTLVSEVVVILKKEKYDLIFLGDSFTEGVGLNYEDTFVGLFENKSKMNILNLGVQSYSPSLHLKKINFLIKNKVKFKEAIIAIDISDLYDEFSYNPKLMYDNENNTGICKVASINKSNNFEIIPKDKILLKQIFSNYIY